MAQFLFGIQLGDRDEFAVWQLVEPREAFVGCLILRHIKQLEFLVGFAPVVQLAEQLSGIVRTVATNNHEVIAY